MATGGVHQKSSTPTAEGNNVRLFFTSYTDDFFAERELFKREVRLLVGYHNHDNDLFIFEPRCEKTSLWGFRAGLKQCQAVLYILHR